MHFRFISAPKVSSFSVTDTTASPGQWAVLPGSPPQSPLGVPPTCPAPCPALCFTGKELGLRGPVAQIVGNSRENSGLQRLSATARSPVPACSPSHALPCCWGAGSVVGLGAVPPTAALLCSSMAESLCIGTAETWVLTLKSLFNRFEVH